MTTTTVSYQRALDAVPELQPVVRVVDALCALVRDDDTLCSGCVWEVIVKPLVVPWLGWERGSPPEQASDDQRDLCERVNFSELLSRCDHRTPATTATESWLRTSEAYDAFTRELIGRLQAVDPAHGHGIRRGHYDTEG